MTDMRERIREQTQLATTYAEDGCYISAARILRELAAEVTRHAINVHAPSPLPVDQLGLPPAILALGSYAAEAEDQPCGEGYWNDMEDANWDGQVQGRSYAASVIRPALEALGLDAPAGFEVCGDCFRSVDDHHGQCQAEAEEDQEASDAA